MIMYIIVILYSFISAIFYQYVISMLISYYPFYISQILLIYVYSYATLRNDNSRQTLTSFVVFKRLTPCGIFLVCSLISLSCLDRMREQCESREMESERFQHMRSVFALFAASAAPFFAARFAGKKSLGNVCVMQQTRSLYRGTSLQNPTYGFMRRQRACYTHHGARASF